jgi:hypothetical protein
VPASPTARRPTRPSAIGTTRAGSRWRPSAPSASSASTRAWPRGWSRAVDPQATPACANACIAGALTFGDLDDPGNGRTLLRENRHFRMHEELGTGPGFYYLWDRAEPAEAPQGEAP